MFTILVILNYVDSIGYGQKPLRTEAPGSKSDKVDKSPWMNLTTKTNKSIGE